MEANERRIAFENELKIIFRDYPIHNADFILRADNEATKILSQRLGRSIEYPYDFILFRPGDLSLAAKRARGVI
jgi:hypothetical protein